MIQNVAENNILPHGGVVQPYIPPFQTLNIKKQKRCISMNVEFSHSYIGSIMFESQLQQYSENRDNVQCTPPRASPCLPLPRAALVSFPAPVELRTFFFFSPTGT